MTLSKAARRKNLEEAILLLMDGLHGKSVLESFVDERYIDDRILPTTWEEMKRQFLVRQASQGWYYTLSGPGWLAGLRLQGQFDTHELATRIGQLCTALKQKVKGRQYKVLVQVDELARESGIDAAFIRNAIEADLIYERLGIRGAEWASPEDRGKFIIIPVEFGMEAL